MGLSTFVTGYRSADDKWDKMKAIYDSCESAKVVIPDEVLEYFCHEDPQNLPGLEVPLGDAIKVSSDESTITIELSAIPKDVHFVRFTNSW